MDAKTNNDVVDNVLNNNIVNNNNDANNNNSQPIMRSIYRWWIGETISKDYHSWTKKGHDKTTAKCVALTFMLKSNKNNNWKKKVQRIQNEIQSLRNIKSKYIRKIYAYNLNAKYPTTDNKQVDTILIVSEYCAGGQLLDLLLNNLSFEPIIARTYFRQAIFGLEVCHNAGVAHRNLCTNNLLLNLSFTLKITGFGHSKLFQSDYDTIMKTCIGQKGYIAPEILLDKKYDIGCDIFSMGVILFILLNGYPPFENAYIGDKWYKPIIKGNYNKFWKYHKDCNIIKTNDFRSKFLIERMLCFNPIQRIKINDIKKHSWFNDTYLSGKELIKVLRLRHHQSDINHQINIQQQTQNNGNIKKKYSLKIKRNIHCTVVAPLWPDNIAEDILFNTFYTTYCVMGFFQSLSSLIDEIFRGSFKFNKSNCSMLCNVRIMEQKDIINNNNLKQMNYCDFKFNVYLYQSRKYYVKPPSDSVNVSTNNNNNKDVNDLAAEYHDNAISNTYNRECVYIAKIVKIEGDDLGFKKKVQIPLINRGLEIFCGLPKWALNIDFNNDIINISDDDTDDEYDDFKWDTNADAILLVYGYMYMYTGNDNDRTSVPKKIIELLLTYYGTDVD